MHAQVVANEGAVGIPRGLMVAHHRESGACGAVSSRARSAFDDLIAPIAMAKG